MQVLISAPAALPLSFAIIDDARQHLWRRLQALRDMLPAAVKDLLELEPFPPEVPTSIDNLVAFVGSRGCDVLLVNSRMDPPRTGDRVRALVTRYGKKAPFRMFIFSPAQLVDGLASDLLPRGADGVFALNQQGMRKFRRYLETFAQASPLSFEHPALEWGGPPPGDCTPPRLNLLRLLFPESDSIYLQPVGGKGAAALKFLVRTDDARRYFVKLGRWDSLAAEYANYLSLVQGKYENFAGRAIGQPVVRGSEAALRFSLAGIASGEPLSLEGFLHGANVTQGVAILESLKRRLSERLRLRSEPFEPLKYLRVLPSVMTLDGLGFDPQPHGDPFPFSSSGTTDRISLRRFLESVRAGDEVQIKGVAIQEIRPAPGATEGIILQLSDMGEQGKPLLGLKVNVRIEDGSLLSSLKLHRGKRLMLVGRVRETLRDTLLAHVPPLVLPQDLMRWAPEDGLYDLLFGNTEGEEDAGESDWVESRLTGLQDVPVGDFTHGDFNLANILVEVREDEDPIPWLIDFEKSSDEFYPAFDCAKLEVEICLHLIEDETLDADKLSALEHSLWSPRYFENELWVPVKPPGSLRDKSLDKVLHWQNTIRKLVADDLTTREFADYLFGIMCYSLRALCFPDIDAGRRSRLYVKAAVACKRIYQIFPFAYA